jgi:nuclear pore complex protein Nup188
VLRESILPWGPRVVVWWGVRAGGDAAAGGCENLLEEKAVGLLEGIRDVLGEEGE